MARRRYVSTTISQDTRVNTLAVEYGDFAALLYTWMIPHAADDATLPGDPEELLYQVLPGRRDKSVPEVRAALDGMAALGLVEDAGGGRIMFPLGTLLEKENQRERRDPRLRIWRKTVMLRDHFQCRNCEARGVKLFAHHILPYALYPDLRFDVHNGITLCGPCHDAEHGKGSVQ